MISMMQKRDALAAYLKSLAEAHFPALKLETRYRAADDPGTARAIRIAVMGDPTWYMEVLHESGPEGTTFVNGGQMLMGTDRFHVYLWRAYRDAPDYNQSSQAEWDRILFAQEGTPGIYYALTQAVSIGACPVTDLGTPDSDVVPLDGNGYELAHFAHWTITLEG